MLTKEHMEIHYKHEQEDNPVCLYLNIYVACFTSCLTSYKKGWSSLTPAALPSEFTRPTQFIPSKDELSDELSQNAHPVARPEE